MASRTRAEAFVLLLLHANQCRYARNDLNVLYPDSGEPLDETLQALQASGALAVDDRTGGLVLPQPLTAEATEYLTGLVRKAPRAGESSHFLGYVCPECSLDDCEYVLKRLDEAYTHWSPGMDLFVRQVIRFLEDWATRHEGEAGLDSWKFVNFVIMVQCFSIFSHGNLRLALALGARAEAVAASSGNERIKPFIGALRLYLQSLFTYPDNTDLDTMTRYTEQARQQDDPALGKLMPWLVGTCHFMHGEYQQVVDGYRRITDKPHWWYHRLFDLHALSTLYSANYLGQYHLAVGISASATRLTALTGETTASLFYRIQQCFLQLRIGDMEQALAGIHTITHSPGYRTNSFLNSQCARVQALSMYIRGDIQAAYAFLEQEVRHALERDSHVSPFYEPFILDMLYVFEQKGYPPIPQYHLDTLMASLADSDNTHLRGAALRIHALREQDRGLPPARAAEILQRSFQCAVAAGDPRELSLTAHVLANTLEQLGKPGQSGQPGHAGQAHRLRQKLHHAVGTALHSATDYQTASMLCLSAAADFVAHAAQDSAVPLQPSRTGRDILAQCHKAFHTFPVQEPLDDMCLALVKRAQEALDAEQVALFSSDGGVGIRCKGAVNLASVELESQTSQPYMDWLREVMYGNYASSFIHESFGLCLVLDVGGATPWLMNIRNHMTAGLVKRLTHFEVQDLARLFAAELRSCLRIDKVRDTVINNQYARLKNIVAVQEDGSMPPLVGDGLQALMRKTLQASTTDAPILLWGETGVGKEVMARHIHKFSECPGPFIAIHPASMPETLFESECFGHERGAFTGAVKQKIGLFELADRGTLFIDEIGEISPLIQTKLLRVLQEKRFMRVGGTHEITSRFRLVAATNRDLWKEVLEGRFRQDLLYRISVVPLKIPALRERRQDILPLATAFIAHFTRRHGKTVQPLSPEQEEQLCAHAWPGNIRELKNVLERAVILSDAGDRLHFEPAGNLPAGEDSVVPSPVVPSPAVPSSAGPETVVNLLATVPPLSSLPTLPALEEHYLRHVLQLTNGHVLGPAGAAALLNLKHTTLYAKLRKYGIRSSGKA